MSVASYMNYALKVYGTYRSSSNGFDLIQLDLMETEKVNQLCQDLKPDIIVWSLAGKKDEVLLSEIGLSNILKNTFPHVRFIYISTTFSSDGNQKEDYLPNPVSENEYLADYVNGKIIGENLTRTKQNHVIIRTGQIFGFYVEGKPDIRMKRLLAQKNSGCNFNRTANNQISIIHVEDLAKCILELCFNDFIGTMNIASEIPLSHFSFYKLLADMMHIDDGFIIPEYDDYPQNTVLDVSKCMSVLKTRVRDFI